MKPCSSQALGIWSRAVFAFVSVASLLGCSSAPLSSGNDTEAESDGVICGSRTALTADGEAVQIPSWFNTRGMNAKLRFYPAFAEVLGLDRVSSCAEAEAYQAAYAQYASEHPNFDIDQPYEGRPVPPLPDHTPPVELTEKIAYGDIGPFAPVVKLNTTYKGKSYECTGTFIAKNWIMTAAHCLNIGEKPTIVADNAYYPYTITWGDALGHVGKQLTVKHVLQLVNPDFTGTFGPGPIGPIPQGADFALLYLDGSYDKNLPRSAMPEWDFMLLSSAGTAPLSARAWGWGAPASNLLESMPLTTYSQLFQSSQDITSLIAVIPANPPYVCSGDSGGPLVHKYFRTDPTSGQTIEVPAAVATLVAGAGKTDTSPCADKTGTAVVWGRIDQNMRFIRRVMRQRSFYGPNFDCKYQWEVGSTSTQLAQCWLTPCLDDSQCEAGTRCINSGSEDWFTCPANACDGTPQAGSCGCIRGKCQPIFDSSDLSQL